MTKPSAKRLAGLALGLGLTLALAAVQVRRPGFILFLEHKVYDTLLASVHRPRTGGAVVIVDLDEKSLREFGQWPWPRYRVAWLLDRIRRLGARAVGLDMVLAEPDRTSPGRLLPRLDRDLGLALKLTGLPAGYRDFDSVLAETLGRGPFALAFHLVHDQRAGPRGRCVLHPLNVIFLKKPGAGKAALRRATGVICNLAVLARRVRFSGFMDVWPDSDGVIRRAPLVMEYRGKFYPSFALATLLRAQGTRQVICSLRRHGADRLRVGRTWIPLGERATMLIHFRGQAKKFAYVSAADVLAGRAPADRFSNKIVLVGTSAAGLRDIRATPLSAAVSGVEINATIIDNILQGDFLVRPAWARGLELEFLVILGLLSTLLLIRARPVWGLGLCAAAAVAVWGAARWMLGSQGVFVSPVMPLITLGLCFGLLTGFNYWYEERQLRRRSRELAHTQNATIRSLAALAECRDPETGGHILRTQNYVRALAEHLAHHPRFKTYLTDRRIDQLFRMAPLHDIGKVGVPDAILMKAARLSDEEFEQMKRHAMYGGRVIDAGEKDPLTRGFLEVAKGLVLDHHERWDGTGYPQGLAGEAISIPGRLMAVADVYDALVSARVYKPPFSHQEAVRIIKEGRGTHFDPDVVDAFLEIEEAFKHIAREFVDSEEDQKSPARDYERPPE